MPVKSGKHINLAVKLILTSGYKRCEFSRKEASVFNRLLGSKKKISFLLTFLLATQQKRMMEYEQSTNKPM